MPVLAGSQPPTSPALTAPVLPQFIVEAGLVPSPPVDGPGTFILDSPSQGILGTNVLGASTIWTDISQWVLGFTITRPSTRLQGPLFQYQAGTASITLDNSDGRFDPDNPYGPYVGAGVSQLVPMVPVRVRAVFNSVTYPLFWGFADGWLETAVDYEAGYSEVTLSATDVFKVLAGVTVGAVTTAVGTGESSGTRIRRILDSAGWYTAADKRTIATGTTFLQGTLFGDSALNLMQIACDSEIGQLFQDPSGAVVFRDRKAPTTRTQSVNVQALFGDLPGTVTGELPYAQIGRGDDDTTLANDIQATNVGGTLQEAKDGASLTKYLFPRTYSRTDLILLDDPDALVWAQWVLVISKTAEDRFDTLTVDPLAQPDDLWPQVLGRDMGDRLRIIKRPAGLTTSAPADNLLDQSGSVITDQGGAALASELPATVPLNLVITKDEFITGLTHTFDAASSAWSTQWTLTDAGRYGNGPPTQPGFFTLGDPVLGRLDFDFLG